MNILKKGNENLNNDMKTIITIEALVAIDAIHRYGTFALAAKSLHKVPSALTYTVKKLEYDLKVSLFNRDKQRATLTQAGEKVLEQGREILKATEQLRKSVQNVQEEWDGELKIARDSIISEQKLFDTLQLFNKTKINADIYLSEEVLGGSLDAIENNRADIVVGLTGDFPKTKLNTFKIGEVQFVFALSKNHPLVKIKDTLTSDDLKNYPTIVVTDTSKWIPPKDSIIVNQTKVIKVHSIMSKLKLQKQGLGIGFLPSHLAHPYILNGDLVVKKCNITKPSENVFIAWHKDYIPSKSFNWFLEKFKKQQWF